VAVCASAEVTVPSDPQTAYIARTKMSLTAIEKCDRLTITAFSGE
jgi:hypothetical protein